MAFKETLKTVFIENFWILPWVPYKHYLISSSLKSHVVNKNAVFPAGEDSGLRPALKTSQW